MKKYRFKPSLNKRFVATHEDYDVYAINPFAVRNVARPDEEFTNFATQDEFPDLIPPGEIWISDKNLDKEGVFFIADALTRMKEKAKGSPEDKAYTAGLNTERFLRRRLNGIEFRAGRPHKRVPPGIHVEHYITLPDPRFPVEIWLVDGNLVRSFYKTDFTEGGHGYVYRWCPKDQIWVEKDLDRAELPFIVGHEYIELRLMRDEKLEYDEAHEICSKMEFKLRKGRGAKPLLAPGRRKLSKNDLPKLTGDEVFEYVLNTYVRK